MLKFIDVIPSRERVLPGESLNILGGAANGGDDVTAEIGVWGRTDGGWRLLMSRTVTVEKGEHKHLYFTLPPELFSEPFWEEDPEELELIIRDRKPEESENGIMIFIG